MKKIILGLVGEIASGKDTVADYLQEKYGSETISYSQPIRDILDRMYLPQTRENMSKLGHCLRGEFGQDTLSKIIAEEVKRSRAKILVLPNVRLESDIVHLIHEPGFRLVRIDCEAKTRFARLTARRQNPDDKNKTWKQFLADAKLYTERHIRDLGAKAKYSLDNNGSKAQLNQQIEELLKQLQKG